MERGLWKQKALLGNGEWSMVLGEGHGQERPTEMGTRQHITEKGGGPRRVRGHRNGGKAHKHQGTHKDKDADTRGPLKQEQPAHGDKGEALRNRNSPTVAKGWVVSMEILHYAQRNPWDTWR